MYAYSKGDENCLKVVEELVSGRIDVNAGPANSNRVRVKSGKTRWKRDQAGVAGVRSSTMNSVQHDLLSRYGLLDRLTSSDLPHR